MACSASLNYIGIGHFSPDFLFGLILEYFAAARGLKILFVYVGKCVFIGRSHKKDKVFPIFLPKNIKRSSAGY